ncbi:oleoyl-acyl carrier protein thioesterase 1, chloroplastic-like isoform X1 [Gossypium arboreum]|uniref:oleoyl-acyl carrier protein thioesterase 1, chloroplastic-like isoform X1 n=1 Tax=Gossypium arboreum TaxID=29729 RepID=UPI0022F17711|nr:oleoyl-acyl carrier protein thioesterase 1, chloroplastic-like isoform X1 [Gossypium arboreum]
MLKFPYCNVTDLNQALAQCRFVGLLGPLASRRQSPRAVVSCSPSSSEFSLTPVQAVMSCQQQVGSSLVNRLRLGGLTEDGLSYKEKFIIRGFEVGINKIATIETIANLLQEVGSNHAQSVGFSTDGFGTTPTMRKLHLIWVTARMHIEVYKYPAWRDVIEIETWSQNEGRIGTRRDWILNEVATGEVIGRATSKWVMMNQDTRRMQKVSDDVKEEYLVFCPREPRYAFSFDLEIVSYHLCDAHVYRLAFSEKNNKSLKRIAKLEDPVRYSKLGLKPRRADLDMNQHVNNVTYIGWVLESIPKEIIDTHELQAITLFYRRECQQYDVVDSLTGLELTEGSKTVSVGTNGSATATATTRADDHDCHRFLHLLRLSSDGREISRGRTEWRKKPTR